MATEDTTVATRRAVLMLHVQHKHNLTPRHISLGLVDLALGPRTVVNACQRGGKVHQRLAATIVCRIERIVTPLFEKQEGTPEFMHTIARERTKKKKKKERTEMRRTRGKRTVEEDGRGRASKECETRASCSRALGFRTDRERDGSDP